MKLFLIVAKGKHKGMVIEVKQDLFLFGADKMCQLRSKLPGIVPQHCAIITRPDRKVFLQDLAHGPTELNGDLVPPGEEWPLHSGDRLGVGPLEFMIQFNEKALSQRDAEEWALKCLDERADKREVEEAEIGALDARAQTDASSAASAILANLQAQRGIVKGRLRIALNDDLTEVRFNDRFLVDKAEITMIKKELLTNLSRPNLRVLLDFKNVQRMSSTATEMIKDVRLKLLAQGSTLAMCRLRPDLELMLERMDGTKDIPRFPNKAAALDKDW